MALGGFRLIYRFGNLGIELPATHTNAPQSRPKAASTSQEAARPSAISLLWRNASTKVPIATQGSG